MLIIGASVLIAMTRGFTTEALSLVAWVVALFITLQGHPYVFPYIVEYIQPDFMASVITYAALGITSLILLKFLAGIIGKTIKESHIGALDRGLGILFGIIRGMLIISFAYLLTRTFFSSDKYPEMFMEAKSRPLIEYGASILNTMNPYKDDDLFEAGRFDGPMLDLLKDQLPSFPADQDETGYERENRDELDKLIKESSNT